MTQQSRLAPVGLDQTDVHAPILLVVVVPQLQQVLRDLNHFLVELLPFSAISQHHLLSLLILHILQLLFSVTVPIVFVRVLHHLILQPPLYIQKLIHVLHSEQLRKVTIFGNEEAHVSQIIFEGIFMVSLVVLKIVFLIEEG